MTLAVVDKSNLLGQSWQNIFDTINNRTYVPDPLDVSGKRKFVYTREPNTKGANFAGYPFIVVDQANLSFSRPSLNYKRKDSLHSIRVVVYSTDRLNSLQKEGDGISYLNSISNDLVEALNGDTVKEVLRPLVMSNVNIEVTDSDVLEVEEDTVFTRTFEITTNNRRSVF